MTRSTGSGRAGARGRAIVTLFVLAGSGGCAPPIPDRIPLDLVHREWVAVDDVEQMEGLTFITARGDSVTAYLRRPIAAAEDGLAGVVLVAGRETGRQAAQVVPGPLEAAVLAVEYPDVLPEELTVRNMVEGLPEIRESALRVAGVLGSAAEFLASEREVDRGRIALVGVSFGVPFAAAAGSDTIFRAVALHHGGGDLYVLFRANLPIESGVMRAVAARFLSWYLRPLDPLRHIEDIGPKPLLLINGIDDTQVPRESALKLAERATGPVRHIWLPHDHLMPGDTALMRELADSTISHFDFLAPSRP